MASLMELVDRVNKGEAVVLTAPKSSVSKALEEMADLFAPSEARRKRR